MERCLEALCGVAAWLQRGDLGGYGRVYRLLLEQQHRGHDAAGVALLERNGKLRVVGGRGYVWRALPEPGPGAPDSGLVIGHVRYSTSGGYGSHQPVASSDGSVAVAFNGTLVNHWEASRELLGRSIDWDARALAEILSALLREHGSLAEAVREASHVLRGAYSLVAVTSKGELAAARDPLGVRPLAYSSTGEALAVASETGALQALGLPWRELPAGGLLYCPEPSPEGCGLERLQAAGEPRPCAFEYIYFLRPDSVFEGVVAHLARKRMGALLALGDTVEADLVAPVPDSGRSAALGYAEARGARLEEVFYLNRFIGRAFISSPSDRRERLDMKYSVIPGTVEGKRIILVDDSIVRGDTARRLTALLRGAGAREVHLRSAAPPVVSPCFLGVDIPTRSELVAYGRSVEEVARLLGVDSLRYNTPRAVEEAVGRRLCMGCFTGSYPLPLDVEVLEHRLGQARRALAG